MWINALDCSQPNGTNLVDRNVGVEGILAVIVARSWFSIDLRSTRLGSDVRCKEANAFELDIHSSSCHHTYLLINRY